MKEFQDTCRKLLSIETMREDRTKTGTFGYFGEQWRFNLLEGFPLVSSKFTPIRAIKEELLWILAGGTNNNDLVAKNVHIWDEWALENGDLGPIYGKQWRSWATGDGSTIDQIQMLIDGIKAKPFSRRHIVTAWQPNDIMPEALSKDPKENVRQGKMALAPCHCFFQFYVSEMTSDERLAHAHDQGIFFAGYVPGMNLSKIGVADAKRQLDARGVPRYKLSCQLYQRSADFCLGVPFNTASYAMLTMMAAQCVDMAPGDFIHTFGDLHMYSNHVAGAKEWVERDWFDKPRLRLNPEVKDIFAFKSDDIALEGYKYYPKINFDVAY